MTETSSPNTAQRAHSAPRKSYTSQLFPIETLQLMQTSIPVSSRMFGRQIRRDEEKRQSDQQEESRSRNIAPVDPNASFLQPTKSWNASYEDVLPDYVPIEKTPARRLSLKTGPQVESRLYESTTAHERQRWRPKDEVELENQIRLEEEMKGMSIIGGTKKVSKVSEHILTPTKATEASMWRKDDSSRDPRELGWKVAGAAKRDSFPLSPASNGSELDSIATPENKSTRKIKEPSSRILTPTIGNRFARWNPPEDDVPKPIQVPKQPPRLSSYLLAPTVKMHLASYVKPVVEVDPREKGMNDRFHVEKPRRSSIASLSGQSNDVDLTPLNDAGNPATNETNIPTSEKKTRRVSEVSESLIRPTIGNLHARWIPPNMSPSKKTSVQRSKSMVTTTETNSGSTSRGRSMSVKARNPQILVKEAVVMTQNRTHWEEYKKTMEFSPSDQNTEVNSQIVVKSKKQTSIEDIDPNTSVDQIYDTKDSDDVERRRSFCWASVPSGISILEAAKQSALELEEESPQQLTRPGEISASLLKPTAATENSKWNKPVGYSQLKTPRSDTSNDDRTSGPADKKSKDLDIFHKKKSVNPLSTPRKSKSGSVTSLAIEASSLANPVESTSDDPEGNENGFTEYQEY